MRDSTEVGMQMPFLKLLQVVNSIMQVYF